MDCEYVGDTTKYILALVNILNPVHSGDVDPDCYGDTSNILILNCIKIIDTYNTSESMYRIVRVTITKSKL